MRNVRIFYKKEGRLKFVSHLDMNRFMSRIIRLAKLPIWYTEGFNPHPYITFALPLSLGFESDYEIVDLKIENENYSNEQVKNDIIAVLPDGITIIDVCDPLMKPGKIAFADFKIEFENDNTYDLINHFENFLKLNPNYIEKTNKKGRINQIDISSKVGDYKFTVNDDIITLYIRLPAGSTDNLNPELLLSSFKKYNNMALPPYSIRRTMIYNDNNENFR